MLNKPVYIRMCILELNKILMYKFNYDYFETNAVTTQNYYLQTQIL